MMPAASISNAPVARAAQLVGFAVVAAALAIVSWRTTSLNLPGVGQFAGIIGSGFLGGIINPLMRELTGEDVVVALGTTAQATQTAEAAQDKIAKALGAKSDLIWELSVVIGGVAIVVAALALAINGDQHANAAPVLTALATAFGALFLDTSKVVHAPSPSPVPNQVTVVAPTPVPAPVPVPVPVPVPTQASASEQEPKSEPESEPEPKPEPKPDSAPKPEPTPDQAQNQDPKEATGQIPSTEKGQDT